MSDGATKIKRGDRFVGMGRVSRRGGYARIVYTVIDIGVEFTSFRAPTPVRTQAITVRREPPYQKPPQCRSIGADLLALMERLPDA